MAVEFDHTIEVSLLRASQRRSDRLGRRPVARLLADLLLAQTGVVGVYGSWGAGKTFVLDMTIEELFTRQSPDRCRPIVCYFQPWRYEPDTSLAPGLIKTLGEVPDQFPGLNPAFEPDSVGRLRETAGRLLRIVRRVVGVLGPVVHAGAVTLTQVPPGMLPPPVEMVAKPAIAGLDAAMTTAEADGKETPSADLDREAIKERMRQLVQDRRESAARGESAGRAPEEYRVVVVIDDLDRCAPDLLVDMLNWLKVHLSVPGCSYLLALDHEAASKAIVGKYRAYLGESVDLAYGLRYLEKIVDFEVELGESEYVEQMAAQAVSGADSVLAIVERLIHRQGVRTTEMRKLMGLRTLQSPRTMLKVVERFAAVLAEIQRDQDRRGRTHAELRQLPADYSFWLLLLVAMYYRLSPWQIEAFCAGQGPLVSLSGAVADPKSPDASLDPLSEFCRFLDTALRDSRSERVQPTPAVLLYLYTAVRQLAWPQGS